MREDLRAPGRCRVCRENAYIVGPDRTLLCARCFGAGADRGALVALAATRSQTPRRITRSAAQRSSAS